jgi:hypothetical protein
MAGLTPYLHYRVWCENGIRMPTHKDSGLKGYKHPQPGRDQDCDMILDATKGMDDDDSSIWFCENHGNHTVFAREESHYKLDEPWGKHPQANRRRCEGWLKSEYVAKKKLADESKRLMQVQNDEILLAGVSIFLGPLLNATLLLQSADMLNTIRLSNTTEVFNATIIEEQNAHKGNIAYPGLA